MGTIGVSVRDSSSCSGCLVIHSAELLLFIDLPRSDRKIVNSLGTALLYILFHARKEIVGCWWRGLCCDATVRAIDCGVLDVSKKKKGEQSQMQKLK